MAFAVDRAGKRVVVVPDGSDAGPGDVLVDPEIARLCDLRAGLTLTDAQVDALIAGSFIQFRRATLEGAPHASPPDPGRRAVRAAKVAEALAWVFGVIGVITGLAIALSTDDDFATGETTRPHVGSGVAIMAGAVFQTCLVVMFAAYIQYRVERDRSE